MNSITGRPSRRQATAQSSKTHWASELRKSNDRIHEFSPIRTGVIKPCKDCKHYHEQTVFGENQNSSEQDKNEDVFRKENIYPETRQDRERWLEQGLAFYTNWVDQFEAENSSKTPATIDQEQPGPSGNRGNSKNHPNLRHIDNTPHSAQLPFQPKVNAANRYNGYSASPKVWSNRTPDSIDNPYKLSNDKWKNGAQKNLQNPSVSEKVYNPSEFKRVIFDEGRLNKKKWTRENSRDTSSPQKQKGIGIPQVHFVEEVRQNQRRDESSKHPTPTYRYQKHDNKWHNNQPYEGNPTQSNSNMRNMQYRENPKFSPTDFNYRHPTPIANRKVNEIESSNSNKRKRVQETGPSSYRPNSLIQFYGQEDHPTKIFTDRRDNYRNQQLSNYEETQDDRRETIDGRLSPRIRNPSKPILASPNTRRQTGYWNNPPNSYKTNQSEMINPDRDEALHREIQCSQKQQPHRSPKIRQFDL